MTAHYDEIAPIEIISLNQQRENRFWKGIRLNSPDSLETIHALFIQSTVVGTISVKMVLELAEYLIHSSIIDDNFIDLVEYASSNSKSPKHKYLFGTLAYKLRKLTKNHELRARCILDLGLASAQLGIKKQSLPLIFQAKDEFVALGSNAAVVFCNRILAEEYLAIGKTAEALNILEEIKLFYESNGELLELASTNFTMGNLYYQLTDYKSALNYYSLAKDTFISIANGTQLLHKYIELSLNVALCNLSMAAVYDDMGMHQQAAQLCESAREIYSRKGYDSYDKTGLAKCDRTLATVYSRLNQPHKALVLYEQAKLKFKEAGFELEVALCDKNMAGIYDSAIDDQNMALQLFQEARNIFENNGVLDMVQRIDLDIAIVKKNAERKKSKVQDTPIAFRMMAEKLGNVPVIVTMSSELAPGMLEKYDDLVKQGASPKDRALYLLYNTKSDNPTNVDKLIELCEPLIADLKQEPRIAWQIHHHLAQAYRHKASLFYYYTNSPLFPIALESAGVTLTSFPEALSTNKRKAFYL